MPPDRSLDYAEEEVAVIRRAIAPPPPKPPEEVIEAMRPATGLPVPDHMPPFWKLSDLEFPLFMRLTADPIVKALSRYAFFPEVLQRMRSGQDLPKLEFSGRARGMVTILRFADRSIVIKPLQNGREDEIARTAGEIGVGPAQLESLPGYLTEEFVPGTFFTELPEERLSDDFLEGVGSTLGDMLRRLHQAGIYYNDVTFSDPRGRSHLLVQEDGSCRLIDFGISLMLDRHPRLEREEVHNFVRTLPMYRVFRGMAEDESQVDRFLEEYAGKLAAASKSDITSRDLAFAEQGLNMAARRMGELIIEPVRKGFKLAYSG
jgi:tRNA A-37 threonylcarbamoyl transferase component Bud32